MDPSNGVQEKLQPERRTSTANSLLELKVMTRKALFHLSLHTGKVRDGTEEAGVK